MKTSQLKLLKPNDIILFKLLNNFSVQYYTGIVKTIYSSNNEHNEVEVIDTMIISNPDLQINKESEDDIHIESLTYTHENNENLGSTIIRAQDIVGIIDDSATIGVNQERTQLPSVYDFPQCKIQELIDSINNSFKKNDTINVDTNELLRLIKMYNDEVVPF